MTMYKSLKYPREIKVILWKSSKRKEISSEIHNSPWKSSVDEKGPMHFFSVNNCMNAWESSNDHKKLKPCPEIYI